jgi:hypothetical protein
VTSLNAALSSLFGFNVSASQWISMSADSCAMRVAHPLCVHVLAAPYNATPGYRFRVNHNNNIPCSD